MWPIDMAPTRGLLPYFLLYTSLSAFLHSIACYLTPIPALRHFSGPQRPPATPLLAHVYAVKNIYTSAIRAYAAYDTTNQALYDLAILSFIGVAWLFVTELAVYRTEVEGGVYSLCKCWDWNHLVGDDEELVSEEGVSWNRDNDEGVEITSLVKPVHPP